MIIEFGHYALVLAFILSLVQAVLPALGAARGKQAWMMMGRQASASVFYLLTLAFLTLLHAYALSDFSVFNVASNSHTMKPLLYKMAATWGNHEGSMMLWVWMLGAWGFFGYRAGKNLPQAFQARVLSVQGALVAGVSAFILFASNPFLRLDPPAPEGLDLNPLLQDPLLAIHPPVLYAGYVGFSMAYSFAVAALIEGRVDQAFARALRPWVLAAWIFLTSGIALGAFWAYYELGWGGFWFWDPVENASLMPWLAGTALLHVLTVLEKRGAFPAWTIFLALLTFVMSMTGTFLVRSGLLTSVHAFAADPMRGLFILGLLALVAGGGFALFAVRAPDMKRGTGFAPFSRESLLLLNNVFLCAFLATVFVGVSYPLILTALNTAGLSVGASYFNTVLLPLMIPFAALMGIAPALPWRRAQPDILKAQMAPALMTVVVLALVILLPLPITPWVLTGVGSAAWITAATLRDLWRRSQGARALDTLPRSYSGMVLAHLGFACLLLGATAATQWGQQQTVWMKSGDRVQMHNHNILLLGVEAGFGVNYNANRALFSIQSQRHPEDFRLAMPEKRWYPVQEKETSETFLSLYGADVLYLVLGEQDPENDQRWVVRMYYHPLILLVFFGAFLMAAGGVMAALPRRKKSGDDAARVTEVQS